MGEGDPVPEGLLYTKDHEWVRMEGPVAVVGITDHAQRALGDLTYVELPAPGKEVKRGQEIAAVESAKAAADVFAPLSGTVIGVNSTLEDAPEKINADPYTEGWILKLSPFDESEAASLLTPAQYRAMLAEEAS